MDEVKTKIDNVNTKFEKVRAFLEFDKAPDCLVKLNETLQDGSINDVTVDEFSDLVGCTRQTIWNYTHGNIIDKANEKSSKMLISIKDYLIPMSLQIVMRKMSGKLAEQQTNVICFYADSADPSQAKAILEEKYPKSVCFTMNDLFESLIDLIYFSVPIEEIADRVKVLIDSDIKSIDKKYESEKAVIEKDVDEVLKKTYIKTQKEFQKLLNEIEVPPEGFHCDINEFCEVLGYMAQQKALNDAMSYRNTRLRSLLDTSNERCKKYSPCVNGEVGKEYARLYKKAYRQIVGENIRNHIKDQLDQKHFMIYSYICEEDLSANMKGIDNLFDSIKFTNCTYIMGYDSLDQSLKAFVDTKVNMLKKKNLKSEIRFL